jgi:hypothetical protein
MGGDALEATTAYRQAMAGFATMGLLDIWYAHLDSDELLEHPHARPRREEGGDAGDGGDGDRPISGAGTLVGEADDSVSQQRCDQQQNDDYRDFAPVAQQPVPRRLKNTVSPFRCHKQHHDRDRQRQQ